MGRALFLLSSLWFISPITLSAQSISSWTVDPTPLFTVGRSPNDPLDQLARVSAASWRGPKGLVVANGWWTLRFYDERGAHLRTSGREGQGPGDYRHITSISSFTAPTNDTIVVYDLSNRRVSLLDADGDFVRSRQLIRAGMTGPDVRGVVGDEWVLVTWATLLTPETFTLSPGLLTHRRQLVLQSLRTDSASIVGSGAGPESYLYPSEVRPGSFAIRHPPFSPEPRYFARANLIFSADGDTYSARVANPSGRAMVTVGNSTERVRMTETIKRAWLGDTIPDYPTERRARIEEILRTMMVHDYLPLIGDMQVDDEGQIWLRRRTATGMAPRWDVFSPRGPQIASVTLPEHERVLDISHGAIVLLHRGPFGVELVSVHPFTK